MICELYSVELRLPNPIICGLPDINVIDNFNFKELNPIVVYCLGHIRNKFLTNYFRYNHISLIRTSILYNDYIYKSYMLLDILVIELLEVFRKASTLNLFI